MKIKNRFKKAVAVLMLVTMTSISVCACADKSGSDKSGEPGAVQGNYYLDADKSKQYISFNEDNSFRFVGYDFEALAKDLVGDMIEDKTALAERLDDAYTYSFDKDTNELWFNVLQSDSSDSAEFVVAMQLGGDKQSVTFQDKTYTAIPHN